MTAVTPAGAWARLVEGNERHAADRPENPRHDAATRQRLLAGQQPIAAVIACSDSRVPPELVLDAGLGDLFVVRNAGQVVTDAVVASVEYAVAELHVPLVVVLAHEGCGAVAAAAASLSAGAPALPPLIAAHVAPIVPAARAAASGDSDAGALHLERSVIALLERSELLAAAVADGTVGVVGARYDPREGRVRTRSFIGVDPADPSEEPEEHAR